MTNKEKILLRLEEQLRIYKDSPQVQVTYIDLARVIEDIIEMLGGQELNGFTKKEG